MFPTRSLSSDSGSTIKANGTNGASDERTPLLATISPIPTTATIEESISATHDEEDVHLEDPDAPLDYTQILILCLARMVDPISFFSIFPYINAMIERTGGIEKAEVGFYSGLIESLFSITQMCVMIFWGKAADRLGRKPCLIISLFGVSISMALFGTSKTLWEMVLFRCLAGVFAGTLVTVRAMITENSTKKTQARAFSYFAFTGNLGIFIGPFIGGVLESPARKFPSTIGRIQFFVDYPYALPGFASASVGLIAAIIGAFFLRETLHIHHHNRKANHTPMSTRDLIKHDGVSRVLVINSYIAFMAFAYTAAMPVFLYTPIRLGGIGFSPELIAATIGLNGVSQALWILFVFPPLQHRIGTIGVLKLCAAAWPFFFAVHSICYFLRRYELAALFWVFAPVNCVIGSGVAMAFTAQQLAVNDIAPTHETLGSLNAIALALSSGMRSFAPALSTSILATGIKYRIAGGQFFWILAVIVAIGLSLIVRLLPKKADGKLRGEWEEEEEVRS